MDAGKDRKLKRRRVDDVKTPSTEATKQQQQQKQQQKPEAYSSLLRGRREKNKAVLMGALQPCTAFHLLFAQIYFIDLLSEYAAMYYPEYAKMPETLRTMALQALCRDLANRPRASAYCDGRRFARFRHGLYWDAVQYIMRHLQVGHMGFFKTKYGCAHLPDDAEVCRQFVVVWKHPDAEQLRAEDRVPIIGVIFPCVLPYVPVAHHNPFMFGQAKRITLGGDMSALGPECDRAWVRIHQTKCSCGVAPEVSADRHLSSCDVKKAYAAESANVRASAAFCQPPADGYYKVHYLAFWAEAPNESGSEVSQDVWDHRVKVFELLRPYACHFVDDLDVWPPESTPSLRTMSDDHLLHLPFIFDPYSVNDWQS